MSSSVREVILETDYQVRLDVFEGPLDLLLFLVRKEEVEIYDLSLERLTQQYLDYLAAVPQPDLDRAGDFIALAAHLIYLKSRRLLPPEQRGAGGDDAEEEDPHWELIRQLVEYKKFKEAAGHLQAVEGTRRGLFPRPQGVAPEPEPEEDALSGALALGDVGVFDLLRAFQRTLKRFEAKTDATKDRGAVIFEENYTVADKIERLRNLMSQAREQGITFTELFSDASSRVELAVTFLALLELVRLKQLRVVQPAPFEEIVIYQKEDGYAEIGTQSAEVAETVSRGNAP